MICKKLVELFGGRIDVESEAGRGSTFRFVVRFGIDPAKAQRARRTEVIEDARILVVDDNATSAELCRRTLQDLGGSAQAVTTAEAAFQSLLSAERAGRPFALVLMDWRMPGIDGIEATRRIKRDLPLQSPPPVVIVTFALGEEIHRLAESVGAETVLHKPVSHAGLRDSLRTLLEPGAGPGRFDAEQREMSGEIARVSQALGGSRVLLVEDNEINQEIVIELLQSVGVEVVVVGHGREAVDLLLGENSPSFDGVLMDVQMPVMGGYEATRRILADPRYQDLPIVGLTAHAIREERERCFAAGMRDHLTKPVDPPVLYRAMARHFRISVARQAASARTGDGRLASADQHVPDGLPGLDAAVGLRRVQGNRRLYEKLLRSFAEEQGASAGRIGDLIAAGELRAARQLAHTLKGLAGNIGAGTLFRTAAALDQALREARPLGELEARTGDVQDALASCLTGIDELLCTLSGDLSGDGRDDPEPVERGAERGARLDDPQRAGALLERLIKALAQAELDEETIEGLRVALAPEDFGALERLLDGFEFEQAARLARTLKDAL